MDQKTRADRILGCLMGGAIGDALGAAFENQPTVSRGVPFPLGCEDSLYVTDDTQLTLATCEGIALAGRIDAEAIAQRFVVWFRERRISGIGASTLKAITELAAGAHWALAGASGERSAGNGAAMRVAPLAFFLDPTDDIDRRTLHDLCRITHRNEEAYCGALAIVTAVRMAAEGAVLQQELLPRLVNLLPDSLTRDRLESALTEKLTLFQAAKKFGTSGHVAASVPLAILHAIEGHRDVASLMGFVTGVGGDTDTIGSMAGQILGASLGAAKMKFDESLFEQIDLAPEVKEAARNLAAIPA
ncbi:ADP-ribosylglycohydrolase family protein [Blastopirellula retiformator]|uniref:ADP-ribosyl-[dinitrogen reductase] glycohydrolase n=1 Tax=Blastopirellula retiformator TaxID=2527970 RepID=A0A5C5UZ65_9BACT|nr:ADP-ribosylglycohydrolase family protein [Blastopirellula retiformator]TWT30782.1 ADP-ribosyl-[dinitrogen reductase] glycohydrolase [Blastopirellula retiformator]